MNNVIACIAPVDIYKGKHVTLFCHCVSLQVDVNRTRIWYQVLSILSVSYELLTDLNRTKRWKK
jgi:hypothetical protein